MKSELFDFYSLQREIFGVCPECHDFFRLSDCKIYLKKKPLLDWMDKLDRKSDRLDKKEERIEEIKESIMERGRTKGLRSAKQIIKRIDPIFTPRKLDADDAKVIFHPVDYIVFNGMSNETIRNIMLLDREAKPADQTKMQKSIRDVVEKEEYEWQTLRIKEDGNVKVE